MGLAGRMIGEVSGLKTVQRGAVGVLAVGAVIGGAMAAETADAHTNVKATKVTLDSVTLEPGKYCDASYRSTVDTQDTYHLHKGPSWVPDLFNRTQKMHSQMEAEICLKVGSIIKAKSDANGHYTLNIVGDPNPAKSDLELIVSPVPMQTHFTASGDLTYALMGNSINDLKALGQIAGKNINTFGDNLDSQLQGYDTLVGEDVVSESCSDPAITRLNSEKAQKINLNKGANAPKTLSEDIEKTFFYDIMRANPSAHVSPDSVSVNFELHPGGIANQYHEESVSIRAQAAGHHLILPPITSGPPCEVSPGA